MFFYFLLGFQQKEEIELNREITLKWRNRRTTVTPDEIVYIESYNRHLTVVTVNGKTEIVGKLDEFVKMLPHGEFLSVHKSFAVNMRYIKKINRCDVTMTNGSVVPVSVRRKSAAVREYDFYCKSAENTERAAKGENADGVSASGRKWPEK